MRSVLRAPTWRERVGGFVLVGGCPDLSRGVGGTRDVRSRRRAGSSDQPRPVCGSCRLPVPAALGLPDGVVPSPAREVE